MSLETAALAQSCVLESKKHPPKNNKKQKQNLAKKQKQNKTNKNTSFQTYQDWLHNWEKNWHLHI